MFASAAVGQRKLKYTLGASLFLLGIAGCDVDIDLDKGASGAGSGTDDTTSGGQPSGGSASTGGTTSESSGGAPRLGEGLWDEALFAE